VASDNSASLVSWQIGQERNGTERNAMGATWLISTLLFQPFHGRYLHFQFGGVSRALDRHPVTVRDPPAAIASKYWKRTRMVCVVSFVVVPPYGNMSLGHVLVVSYSWCILPRTDPRQKPMCGSSFLRDERIPPIFLSLDPSIWIECKYKRAENEFTSIRCYKFRLSVIKILENRERSYSCRWIWIY